MKFQPIVLFLTCIYCLIKPFSSSLAQSQTLPEALVEMFSPLDKGKIHTGYLLDQSPDYVNMSLYDGTALVDSNYVDIGVFGNFFRSLNGAKVRASLSNYNVNDIVSILSDDTTSSVNLGAALFEYDYIIPTALQDNLISYIGGKVYDVYSNGVWNNPYQQRYACMLTAGALSFDSLTVPFSFDSEDCFWRNIDPSYIRIDFGDGSGFVNVSSGFNGIVTYSDYGIKEIKLAIELEDETVLFSHTYLNISAPPIQTLEAGLQCDWTDEYRVTYGDKNITATVSCKYATTHSTLIRPLIYVEGFDYAILPNSLASILSNNNPGNSQNYDNFITDYYNSADSLKNEYDAIYVDLWNPLEDIRANAALLESIILDVNHKKHQNGSSERNVVVGHSMGGLIARYALASMEQGFPIRLHETDFYVSYDSPHLGANIPIGAQYAVRDVVNCFYQDGYSSTPFGLLLQWLVNRVTTAFNSTAARQMSYHWISPDGVEDNSVHTAWQEALDQIGFPKGDKGYPIENLSIVNGNIINATILGRPILDATLDANYAVPNVLYYLQTLGLYTKMYVHAEIERRKGAASNISSVEVKYSKHFPWLENHSFIDSYLLNKQHPDSYSPVYYDMVPSSTISLDQYTASILGSSFSMASSLVLGFIPSASAICVPDYSQSRNFSTNQPDPITVSPFSSHFIWDSPQPHGLVFHWHSEWLSDMTRMKLNGPSILRDGDTFNVVDDAGTFGQQWSLSGSINHSINDYGEVSVVDSLPAIVTVSYRSSKEYTFTVENPDHTISTYREQQQLHKHKRVLAGFPSDFHLTKTSSGANRFNIYASCRNDGINAFLDSLATGGSITYWWGTKTGETNIQWTASTSRSYTISPLSVTNVYFKITDGLGREYGLRSDQVIPNIPSTLPVNYDPSVIYTMWGNTYMYYNVIDDPGLFSSYFMLWNKLSATFPQAPDRIVINEQTIMRDVILTETVGGVSKSVYCFNILSSTHLQSVISNISSYPGNTAFVSGSVFSGSTWIQDFTITVRKGFPPLN